MTNRLKIAKDFARKIRSDKIKLMVLFGSVARGDDHEHSDIDILVVSITNIIADTMLNEGELLSIHVMSENVFNETKDYSFLTNVLKEGIVLE